MDRSNATPTRSDRAPRFLLDPYVLPLSIPAKPVDLAAGPLLTSLNTYTTHGDPTIAALSSSLLKTLSAPWFSMLGSWIWEGELRDPWGEFFIIPLEVEDEPEGSEGKGWNGVWEFRKEMLPGFLEEEFGKKVCARDPFREGQSGN